MTDERMFLLLTLTENDKHCACCAGPVRIAAFVHGNAVKLCSPMCMKRLIDIWSRPLPRPKTVLAWFRAMFA